MDRYNLVDVAGVNAWHSDMQLEKEINGDWVKWDDAKLLQSKLEEATKKIEKQSALIDILNDQVQRLCMEGE